MIRQIYKFLSSAKLAIVMLISILVCCLIGVTILRGDRAWTLIFNALWFNGLLVLLVVNVACCFFPRMWGRKLTITSFGMLLFHLSFVVILAGIVYNSLFYFRGVIRLTEGEVLPSGDPLSYDDFDHGPLFNFSKLKGETSLIRMHTGYKIGGDDKRAAYEISVGEGNARKRDIIYITHGLDYGGVTYLNEKEGYSTLVLLYDNVGKVRYGAYVPLQSLKQKNGSYLYTSGAKNDPCSFPFPQEPLRPEFNLLVTYEPSKVKERGGEVFFEVWPLRYEPENRSGKPLASGKAVVGEKFHAGDYCLSVGEIRYWVGMSVRYEPGKPIVLTSLWVGLTGMILTFIGRVRRKRKRQPF